MKSWRFSRTEDELGRALRAHAPSAPDELVQRLAARASATRPRTFHVPRLAGAGALTAAMLVGVAAVGGISYAATQVTQLAHRVKVQHVSMGAAMTKVPQFSTSAQAQYGGITVSDNTVSTVVAPSVGAQTVAVTTPGATGATGANAPAALVTISAAATGNKAVVVHVDPTPPATSTPLVGLRNQLISVVITDPATGQAVHNLSAPIDITLRNPPKGYAPVTSEDGVAFRAIPLLKGTTLPEGQQDGYFLDADGTIHILTRHVTVFAAVFKANIRVSETGKTTPEAGSGLFGDPTRNHTGAPALAQVGDSIAPLKRSFATFVPFTFHVDEQANMSVAIYDAKGKAVKIDENGTRVRGAKYKGSMVKALPLSILRPGQIKTLLKVPNGMLKAGKTYKIRVAATDFDGHQVVQFVSFKA
jgi:hypothetical protein